MSSVHYTIGCYSHLLLRLITESFSYTVLRIQSFHTQGGKLQLTKRYTPFGYQHSWKRFIGSQVPLHENIYLKPHGSDRCQVENKNQLIKPKNVFFPVLEEQAISLTQYLPYIFRILIQTFCSFQCNKVSIKQRAFHSHQHTNCSHRFRIYYVLSLICY